MNNEGETIIEEYLILVRAKLPDTIADDVINELRSYMCESARDQGGGEITLHSAKKVVAQFGAPGEVADEYRYSMFPETIPEEVIPEEEEKDAQRITNNESLQKTEPVLTPIPKEDPSVDHFSFFLKTSFQSIVWAVAVSLMTMFLGPIGVPMWTILVPVSQVCLVICALFLNSLNLKFNRTILWRRAYREWSALQNFVTLPENSVPEMGSRILKLDALVSFVGIILFAFASILGAPFFSLMVMPICALFGARTYYRMVTFKEDEDPIRNSRKQFAINLALLVGLNASMFWLFNYWGYWSYFLMPFGLLLLPFIIGYGSILLMNIVTGVQNLWWKTEEKAKVKPEKAKDASTENKAELLTRLSHSIGRVYATIVIWMVLYNLPQIIVTFDHSSFDFVSSEFYNWILQLLFEIISTGVVLSFYFLYRRLLIKRFDSKRIFGQRTRMEAAVDLIISSIFLIIGLIVVFMETPLRNLGLEIIMYQKHLGGRWATILGATEIAAMPLIVIALLFRITGDIAEFRVKWKQKADSLIEQSSALLIIGITAFVGIQYLRWIALDHWYSSFLVLYVVSLPLVFFLAFQIATSSLKGKMKKATGADSGRKSVKSNSVYSSIAN